jgi:beta-mannosidase
VTHALPIDASRRALETGWRMASSAPGAWACPADIDPAADWLDALVPATVAATLRAHGRWSEDDPAPLHDRDHWYRTTLAVSGRRRLRFDGLATFAEVYLDGAEILTSASMFLARELDVDLRPGAELVIVFRSLTRALDGLKPKRARWRPRLIPEQRLRAVRTTLLGHMPGWCPPIDMIGPWRPITISDPATDPIRDVRLDATHDGIDGHLAAHLVFEEPTAPAAARLLCADCETALTLTPDGALVGELPLAGIAPWWPADRKSVV